MVTLARGDRGDPVLDVQVRLSALGYIIQPREHGKFGPSTERAVREFQTRRQLPADGVVGDLTWSELVEAGYSVGDRVLYLRYPYFRGDDVRSLQASLNLLGFDPGREDGIFGERTDRAVREFQRNVGLPQDGIVGATTVEALRRLRPVGAGPGRATVREREALLRLQATLRGARVAIDAVHGAGEPGAVAPSGLTAERVALALAHAFARELERRGAFPYLLRDATTNPPVSERARVANGTGAEVLIALGVGAAPDAAARGAATFYYGREAWHSEAGRQLAENIRQELTATLGLQDAGCHPRALPLLRETSMPAVYVEPAFITNPRDEADLATGEFADRMAVALADAIERFFGQGPDEAEAETTARDESRLPT